MLRIRL